LKNIIPIITKQRKKRKNKYGSWGLLYETHNRNLKDLSADKSQISANAETSLNSDIMFNNSPQLRK